MNILVTGGAGYIGSHTCVALLEAGHTVIVADNLCNSKAGSIHKVRQITNKEITFYEIDVTDEEAVNTIFSNHDLDGVINFAGLKAVGESVEHPLAYYYNNIAAFVLVAKVAAKEPAIVEGFRRGFRSVVIAFHDDVATDGDLAHGITASPPLVADQ